MAALFPTIDYPAARIDVPNYLKENGIKQTWLSEKTGITRHALCTALNGSRNMDVEEYAKICDALGLDYEYFFNKRAKAKTA